MGERARKESRVSIRKVMGEVQLGIFGLHNFSHSTSVCVWFLLQLHNYPVHVGFFFKSCAVLDFFLLSSPLPTRHVWEFTLDCTSQED